MALDCVLWDLGDTLVDERWLLDGGYDWIPSYVRVVEGDVGQQWNVGSLSTWDVARRVADESGQSTQRVFDDMVESCRSLVFFPHALAAARSVTLPKALVTVNPDVVSEVVIPHYRLAELFDVVVISWQEHNANKADLCDVALGALEVSSRDRALLIDNRSDNVDAWIERGGLGYQFLDDERFALDLASGSVFGLVGVMDTQPAGSELPFNNPRSQ